MVEMKLLHLARLGSSLAWDPQHTSTYQEQLCESSMGNSKESPQRSAPALQNHFSLYRIKTVSAMKRQCFINSNEVADLTWKLSSRLAECI